MSLMHHYEQIYFFGAKGWTPAPAGQDYSFIHSLDPLFNKFVALSSAEKPSEHGGTPESGGSFLKRKRTVGDHVPGGTIHPSILLPRS